MTITEVHAILYWEPSNKKYTIIFCRRSQKFKRYMKISFCTYNLKFLWKILTRTQSADLPSLFHQFHALLIKKLLLIIQFLKTLLLKILKDILKKPHLLKKKYYCEFPELTLAHQQQTTSETEKVGETRLLKYQKNLLQLTELIIPLCSSSQQMPR